MADLCKKCSIETWGKDFGDLAGITTPEETEQEIFAYALCEGCGDILVNHEGEAVNPDEPRTAGTMALDLFVSVALSALTIGWFLCIAYLLTKLFE